MSLIYDERGKLAKPGLHALIVGVGAYPHLQGYVPRPGETVVPAPNAYSMRQLTSTVPTAERVARWLIDHAKHLTFPLATCRLLLSAPSSPSTFGGGIDRSTRANFDTEAKEWRKDASQDPGDATLFYFAGHGVQRSKGDSVMLMEDFGDGAGGTLGKTVSSRNLYFGMANSASFPNVARTQLYFIDACRVMPSEFRNFETMTVPDVWEVELGGEDLRRAPIFYAARSGKVSAGIAGVGTIFSQALLECLKNDAAQLDDSTLNPTWQLTIYSLIRALRKVVAKLNTLYGGDQEFVMDGDSGDATLRVFPNPPKVPIVLEVEPSPAENCTEVIVSHENGMPILRLPVPIVPHPYMIMPGLDGGYYRLEAIHRCPNPHFQNFPTRTVMVQPPYVSWKVRMTP